MDWETAEKLSDLERRIAKLEKGKEKPAKSEKEETEK